MEERKVDAGDANVASIVLSNHKQKQPAEHQSNASSPNHCHCHQQQLNWSRETTTDHRPSPAFTQSVRPAFFTFPFFLLKNYSNKKLAFELRIIEFD